MLPKVYHFIYLMKSVFFFFFCLLERSISFVALVQNYRRKLQIPNMTLLIDYIWDERKVWPNHGNKNVTFLALSPHYWEIASHAATLRW